MDMPAVMGVLKEVKDQERRVSVQPDGVIELTYHGHEVIVEAGAVSGPTVLPTARGVTTIGPHTVAVSAAREFSDPRAVDTPIQDASRPLPLTPPQ
jgi:NAD/NADP transhydrogenase alpha subunit